MRSAEPVTFGVWLRRQREAAGLSQGELARLASMSAREIAALERGRRPRPYPPTIRALADALELSEQERASLLEQIAGDSAATGEVAPASRTLPASSRPLIGRDDDIGRVVALMLEDGARLVTLTGPGGVGKTSLALEVARRAIESFPDGVEVIPLDTLDDPDLVLSWIAARFGLSGVHRDAEAAALRGYLLNRRLLLVLDNVEHLLPAAGDVAELLVDSPGLTVLATSRAPLRLTFEREYLVEPLRLPSSGEHATADDIAASDAVRLLVERAQAISPSFALTDGNVTAIAAVAQRLDGLPLALELAASRLRILGPTELLRRLDQAVPLLSGGARDLPERQRTIRQTIAWSYKLLDPGAQTLFRQLSLYVGGCDVEALDALGASGTDPLEAIATLVEHALVFVETRDGATRYRMLEVVRQFAHEQLVETGELERASELHFEWFLNLAVAAEQKLRYSEQLWWLQRLELEHGNIRAALAWAIASPHPARREGALRIAGSLWAFWYVRGHVVEGETWLRRVLDASPAQPTEARAIAQFGLGMLGISLMDLDDAVATLETSLALAEASGSRMAVALAHFGLGDATRIRRDHDRAEVHYQRALEFFREVGDQAWIGNALNGTAVLAFVTGRLDRAEAYGREGLQVLRACGDLRNIAEAIVILGEVARLRHEIPLAASHYAEALASFHALGDRLAALHTVSYIAAIAAERGEIVRAARLASAVNTSHNELTQHRGRNLLAWMDEPATTRMRSAIGDAAFDRAWGEGQRLALDTAIAEAEVLATELAGGEVAEAVDPRVATLSTREIEVIRLVATGMTNGAIAEQLYISRRTVDTHLRRIYLKLELSGRTDLVRFALNHGVA